MNVALVRRGSESVCASVWINHRKTIVLTLCLVLTVACTVSRYRYISLEDVPGIEIVEHGMPQLEGIRGASSMPTAYRLQRSQYEIEFRVNLDTYNAAVYIYVEPKIKDLGTLRMTDQKWRKIPAVSETTCHNYYYSTEHQNRLGFAWGCSAEGAGRIISFDVVTIDGIVLGQEDVPFQLKSNGISTLTDSL